MPDQHPQTLEDDEEKCPTIPEWAFHIRQGITLAIWERDKEALTDCHNLGMTPNKYPPIIKRAQEWSERGVLYRINFKTTEVGKFWVVEFWNKNHEQWHVVHECTRLFVARFWICAWEMEALRLSDLFDLMLGWVHSEEKRNIDTQLTHSTRHAVEWRAIEAEILKGEGQ